MKYVILFFFFPIFLFGQNWQPLNSQDKYNYTIDTSNYITNTLWIDSLEVNGLDTIYFFNKIAAKCVHCDTIDAEPETKFLELQGQFLGGTVTKKSSGCFLFSGVEEFSLYPNAPLNFSWLYQFDSLNTVTASIAEIGTMEIFGMIDSVKHILIDEMNTIILSKNFGIISFPSPDGNYDLSGIEGRDLGEVLPGIREMYDFQVGDVFQIFTESYGFGRSERTKKIKILGREEQDSSIVYFTNQINSNVYYEPLSAPVYNYSNDDLDWTIDLSYDSPLNFLNETYPHQLHAVSEGWIDYLCYDPAPESIYLPFRVEKDEDTGRILKSTEEQVGFEPTYFYTFINDTSDILKTQACLGHTIYEHVTGLGEVFRYSEALDYVSHSYLMGYIKDGDTTGIITPDNILLDIEEEVILDNSIIINPSISSGNYKLKTIPGFSLRFSIFNSQGQLVQQISKRPSGIDFDFDLTEQPNGIYFVQVWLNENFQNIKIVKM